MSLILDTEVVSIAYDRDIDVANFKESKLIAAEWKYIRPILTNELYEDVITNPDDYTELIEYIKTPLAYYVKYMNHDTIEHKTSNRGLNDITSLNSSKADIKASDRVKSSAVEIANIHASRLLNYILKQEYSLYNGRVGTELTRVGGFLIETYEDAIDTPTVSSGLNGTYQARVIKDGDSIKLQYLLNGTWTDTGSEWEI